MQQKFHHEGTKNTKKGGHPGLLRFARNDGHQNLRAFVVKLRSSRNGVMTEQHTFSIDSPLGPLTLVQEGDALTELHWQRATDDSPTPILQDAAQQLAEYFAKQRRVFDLPMTPAGSAFEQSVWTAMSRIPYGQWRSYGELAAEVDGMPQAVGAACGTNPLPILIPCHRVLAAEGRMGGYSGKGGLKTKQALLVLEGALLV